MEDITITPSDPFAAISVACPCGTTWQLTFDYINRWLLYNFTFECHCGNKLIHDTDGIIKFEAKGVNHTITSELV